MYKRQVLFVEKAGAYAWLDIDPFCAQKRREGMVDIIQNIRRQGKVRIIKITAVHVGQVVGKRRDGSCKPLRRIFFYKAAEHGEPVSYTHLATPDAPAALSADNTQRMKAVGKSTDIPIVCAAASAIVEIVIAAPAMLIVAPRGMEIE